MDAVWCLQVLVWLVASASSERSKITDKMLSPWKPHSRNPHREWAQNNSLGGKRQTQGALLQQQWPEGDWPEPTRIIALIHQTIDQRKRHWFSEAVIRKPQAHRSEKEKGNGTLLHQNTVSHWASHFFTALIGYCWGRDEFFMFLSPRVSASLCFSVSQSSSLSHALPSALRPLFLEQTDNGSLWKTPFIDFERLILFIFYSLWQFALSLALSSFVSCHVVS